MSSTLQDIRTIISEVCDIPEEKIVAGVHLLEGLGIDSVDFLDIVHEINRKYEIVVPIEDWAKAVSQGEPDSRYFVLDRLVENVDALVSRAA